MPRAAAVYVSPPIHLFGLHGTKSQLEENKTRVELSVFVPPLDS